MYNEPELRVPAKLLYNGYLDGTLNLQPPTLLLLPEPVPKVHLPRIHERRATDDVLTLDQPQLSPSHPAHLALRLLRIELLVRRQALLFGQRRRVLVSERQDRVRLGQCLGHSVCDRALARWRVRPEVGEHQRREEISDTGEVAWQEPDVTGVHRMASVCCVGGRGGDGQ